MTTYNMAIETLDGVKPHGFHLGTDKAVAISLVHEHLRRPGVISIALYLGSALPGFPGERVGIFDYRDLPENADDPDLFGWAGHVPAREEDQ
jgi:hypothetical protein